jgi:hypothetical protein
VWDIVIDSFGYKTNRVIINIGKNKNKLSDKVIYIVLRETLAFFIDV